MQPDAVRYALCMLACATTAGAPKPATKAEIDTLAARFPALAAPNAKTPPFIARGAMPHPDDAYDYEIVWTGTRYRAAMLDDDDGTPLIVSDETMMLSCDVPGDAFWVATPARFVVTIEAADGTARLATTHLWNVGSGPADLAKSTFDIRDAIRAAADGSTIEMLDDGSTRLVQPIDAGHVRVVQFAPPPSRNVAFGQLDSATREFTSYHTLLLDGIDVEDATLQMPDFFALGNALSALVNPPSLRLDRTLINAGYLGRIRRAMRGDAACRAKIGEPRVGWAKIAERDEALYTRFRTAFHEAGLAFTPPKKPWATTRPATTREPLPPSATPAP